jgi:hypothetical protein
MADRQAVAAKPDPSALNNFSTLYVKAGVGKKGGQ